MTIKLVLEYDDFSDQDPENCLSFLERMIEEVPDLKVTMFTVPMLRHRLILTRQWVERVHELIVLGHLRLAVHGLTHERAEFQFIEYGEAYDRIISALHLFKSEYQLDTIPVFRPPYWAINKMTVLALVDAGFSHLYAHPMEYPKTSDMNPVGLKVVRFTHNLAHDLQPAPLMIVHGHTHDVCQNGIRETWPKLRAFLTDPAHDIAFAFADEV